MGKNTIVLLRELEYHACTWQTYFGYAAGGFRIRVCLADAHASFRMSSGRFRSCIASRVLLVS